MRVALICWVGHDAFADDLIGGATKAELERLGHDVDMGPWPTRTDHLIKRFQACDAVVFGGGSLICPTKMHPMSKVRQWGHEIGRPLHILGPGFRKETDLLSDEQRELNAFLFSAAKTSWLRGFVTQEEMERNGLKFQHHGHGDPGVLHDVESTVGFEANFGPHLCMVVRNMPPAEVKNVPNELTHEFFRRLCVRWHRDTGGSLHFVSWRHFRSGYDNDFEAANEVVASLPPKLRKRAHVHKPKDWVEAAEITCAGDGVVSQRLHPTVVALTNDVPAVGLDYQFRKMADFASVVDFKYWLDTGRFALGDRGIDGCVASAVYWPTKGVDYPRVREALLDVRRLLQEHIKRQLPAD